MGQLDGRIALITGAGRGQGLAAARLFAREGARVVVNDLDAESVKAATEAIEAEGGEALGAVGDVSSSEDVRRVLGAATDRFGALHVLYNNAGIGYSATRRFGIAMDDVVNCTEEDWARILDINLGGVFLFCKHGIPILIEGGGGVILNTASVAALRGGETAHAYTATKGAIASLTRAIAVTYGPQGIRANTLCPGVIDTEMIHEALIEDRVSAERLAAATPVGRNGTAEDIARAALFLVSDASAFVSGETFAVDGGLIQGLKL